MLRSRRGGRRCHRDSGRPEGNFFSHREERFMAISRPKSVLIVICLQLGALLGVQPRVFARQSCYLRSKTFCPDPELKSFLCFDIQYDASELDMELAASCSFAYAAVHYFCPENCRDDGTGDDASSDAECVEGATSVSAHSRGTCHHEGLIQASAFASVVHPHPDDIEIYQETCAETSGGHCGPVGVAVAIAKTKYSFRADRSEPLPCHDDWQGMLSQAIRSTADSSKILWRGSLAHHESSLVTLALIYNNLGVKRIGLDEDDGVYSGTGELCGNVGDHDIVLLEFFYDNDSFDVNRDGRFNAADVGELESLIGSTNPDLLEQFDFNSSGDIDQEDDDVLNKLVEAGLSAGVFGDVDGDGKVECPSPGWPGPIFNSRIGQDNYKITLDYNLDGDNDLADRAAYLGLCASRDARSLRAPR